MAVICLITACWMLFNGQEVLIPLLGNLFLFKMFVPELESSMGGQMWFISTIIQFYLTWPLIVKLININRGGYWITLFISLSWATIVGISGLGEERVWNSFFLQYLWEFCLGMKLAKWYFKRPSVLEIPEWKFLLPTCLAGLALTGVMGWAGFPWRLYNDIPSLIGYTSLALMVYKADIGLLNRFFSHANKLSYEWYLVHILVFQVVMSVTKDKIAPFAEIVLCLLLSYVIAMGYARFFVKKRN